MWEALQSGLFWQWTSGRGALPDRADLSEQGRRVLLGSFSQWCVEPLNAEVAG